MFFFNLEIKDNFDLTILQANYLFWPIWLLISYTPYMITQYFIDNHERLVFMKHSVEYRDGDNT